MSEPVMRINSDAESQQKVCARRSAPSLIDKFFDQ